MDLTTAIAESPQAALRSSLVGRRLPSAPQLLETRRKTTSAWVRSVRSGRGSASAGRRTSALQRGSGGPRAVEVDVLPPALPAVPYSGLF